jgi:cytosine/adenosine deaminase-related metal-dependent hydrolase
VLIVRGAELVWDGIDEVPGGVVACADGVVVEPSSDGAVELDASGCIVTPGLVNAHHHLLQTAFRTLPGTRGVPMRDWLPRMASAYAAVGVDDELAHTAASAGLAEALLCGVTTVADHHLTWPASTGDGVGIARAVSAAAADLGTRLVFVPG